MDFGVHFRGTRFTNILQSYPVTYPEIMKISDVLYRVSINSFTSIEGKVISSSIATNAKCKAYSYEIYDGSTITLSCYKPLPLEKDKAYTIKNVYLEVNSSSRFLPFKVNSLLSKSKKFADAATPVMKTIKIKSLVKKAVKNFCDGCKSPLLDGGVNDECFLEYNGCKGCGTVDKPDTEYTLHVVYEDTEKQEDLTTSQKLCEAAGGIQKFSETSVHPAKPRNIDLRQTKSSGPIRMRH